MDTVEKLSTFYIRRGTERLGHLNVAEIISLLKDGETFYEIQVLSEAPNKWIPLSRDPELSQMVALALTNAPNTSQEGYSSLSNWRVAGSEKGPYNFLALVQYLQQKHIDKNEWLQHPRFPKPIQIKNIPMFSDLNVETLFEFPLLKPLFQMRKNVRIDYENRVLIYGEHSFYAGSTWSLSAQGLGIILDKNMPLQPGEEVRIHLHKTELHSAIQVCARIVSRVEDEISARLGVVFQHEVEPLSEYIQELSP